MPEAPRGFDDSTPPDGFTGRRPSAPSRRLPALALGHESQVLHGWLHSVALAHVEVALKHPPHWPGRPSTRGDMSTTGWISYEQALSRLDKTRG
jgi:hypothetical protein